MIFEFILARHSMEVLGSTCDIAAPTGTARYPIRYLAAVVTVTVPGLAAPGRPVAFQISWEQASDRAGGAFLTQMLAYKPTLNKCYVNVVLSLFHFI